MTSSPDAGASAPTPDWRSLLEQVRYSDPAKDALGAHIAALEAETLSARRELFAWKAQLAHRQRMKAGVRSAVTWLHRRADSMRDSRACGILHSAATNLGWELARVGPEGLDVAERATKEQRHRAQNAEAEAMALEAELSRLRQAPKVEFHHHDFIPGFAAFLPNATTPAPDSRAFCVLNIGSLLAGVHLGDVPASEIPYAVAECMMHEVMHVLEQWAGVEFSEDRIEALLDKYQAYVEAKGEPEPRPLLGQEQLDAFVRMGEAGGWLEPDPPSRPMTSFLDSLTPEQKSKLLAYRGPKNIGEGEFRLDADDEPPQALVDIMILHDEVAANAKAALDTARPVDLPPWLVEMPNAGLMVRGDDAMTAALAYVERVGAEAVEVARADPPVPLAGSEPWEEADVVYRKRLGLRFGERCSDLDELGAWRGLPRARLALAEG